MEARATFRRFLEQKYRKAFGSEGWNPLAAGLLIGFVNVVSYVWVGKAFTVYTGFLNWGQHLYNLLGLGSVAGVPKLSPLLEPTSVGDIGAILGALLAASLSGEFAIRKPGGWVDVLESICGGLLMALGVALAFGCNWGGFLSAITSWSLHGFAFFAGALAGGYLGLRYVAWRAERVASRLALTIQQVEALARTSGSASGREHDCCTLLFNSRLTPPVLAAAALALLLAHYAALGSSMAGGLLVGVMVGVILQRARFCFATAFRDLFNGPENARAINIHKGIVVAVLSGSIGVFALKYAGVVKEGAGVAPVYVTNVLGGLIFTFGSILAGGCASGLLWRTGEGHVKAWIAMLTTALAYPLLYNALRPLVAGYPAIFLPRSIGWVPAFAAMVAFAALYAALLYYLEFRYGARGRMQQ